MLGPYRAGGGDRRDRAEAPVEAGLVGEVIAQFADPLAFYRELVQNAIDAEARSVGVEIVADADAELVTVAVHDDGEGMSQAIVEDQLLVLFRSTKEHDDTKIGKFGVGFSSVLAPGPRRVTVTTARAGRRLVLHLAPDLTYELFDGGPAERTGTTVRLELAISDDEVAGFLERSEVALTRWCRHAHVPVRLTTRVRRPGAVDEREVRIDRPLALERDDVLVSVRGEADGGALVAIVGLPPDGIAHGGFFDRGLTLHETTEALVPGVVFKVQDGRLGHTISRDNVRRDAAFDRALEVVRELAARALPGAVATALGEALAAGDDARYVRVLAIAAQAARLPADRTWPVPILAARPGAPTTITAAALEVDTWGGRPTSAVAASLAGDGHVVVDLGRAPALEGHLEPHGVIVRDPAHSLSLATPSAEFAALGEAVRAELEAVDRGPPHLVLAELDGFADDLLVATCDVDLVRATPWRFPARPERALLPRFRRPALVLRRAHPLVAAACVRAATDLAGAAALLTRAVLLAAERLDASASARLLERQLDALAVAAVDEEPTP